MARLATAVKINLDNKSEAHLETELANVIQSNVVPIDPTSPFHQSDLVVFSDAYTGLLPMNGIALSEFRALETLYLRIACGQTNFSIQGGPEFCIEITLLILTLLSKKSGRRLIQELVSHEDKRLIIQPTTPTFPNTITKFGRTNNEVTIHFSFNKDQILVRSPHTGSLHPKESPPAINLGHEMIHARNIFNAPSMEEYIATRNNPPRLDMRCENMEEERTIMTFLQRSPNFSNPPSTPDAFRRNSLENVSNTIPVSENILRAEFGLPPRVGHEGVSKPSSDDIHDPDVAEYFAQCCHAGLVDEMKRLIGLGRDPNAYCIHDPKRRTPLMCAASGGAWDAMEVLLKRGALPKCHDLQGLTLLHYAVLSGDAKFVEKLFQMGIVNVHEADYSKQPLLFFAIYHLGERSYEMVELLRAWGASLTAVADDGTSAIHQAATLKDLNLFHSFVNAGANPLSPNHHGIQPLHCALIAGNIPLFYLLCKNYEQFYQRTPCGKSLMFFAMWSGKKEVVAHLLEINRQFQQILAPPFDIMIQRDLSNELPSSCAFKGAQYEAGQDFILYLLSLGQPGRPFNISKSQFGDFVTLFVTAKSPLRWDMLNTVYNNPGYIDEPLCYGESLFRWAVKEGDIELAAYAIAHGAQVNVTVTEDSPTTALHDAVDENKPLMVKFLIQTGADSRVQDINGRTPLECALEKITDGEELDFSIVNMMLTTREHVVAALGQNICTCGSSVS
jgi:ankyrin repeat protein